MRIKRFTITAAVAVLIAAAVPSFGQPEGPARPADEGSSKESASDESPLDERQQRIARRYEQFQQTLLTMLRYMQKNDPERAALLERVIRRSQDEKIGPQMEGIVELLRSGQLGSANEQQNEIVAKMKNLLILLQSENRLDEIAAEKERVKNLLKDLGKIINKQKKTRVDTERRGDPERLAGDQEEITEDTKKLGEKIDRQDAERNGESDEKSESDEKDPDESEKKSDKESKKSKSGDSKEGDSKKGEPGDSEEKSGESKKGEPGDSKKGQSGEPKPGQPGSPSDSQQTPGRQELEKARQAMEQAIEELKKKQHESASGEQDEALRELEKAKEKLEEILRQLREEERLMFLRDLEQRFQMMLREQKRIRDGTLSLDATPRQEWTLRHRGRANQLSTDEGGIAIEAAKALNLLKEDGSSVAFPEAVQQVHQDMLSVARLLGEPNHDTGELTQGIENDIIAALEEMIEALQKEIEDLENQQQQGQQQGQPGDPPLVDLLAELKMLRSLQMRINRRTQRLGSLLKGEQATEADGELVGQLRQLSRAQSRIQKATYDLATGRNR